MMSPTTITADAMALCLVGVLILGTIGWWKDLGSGHFGWQQLVAIPAAICLAWYIKRR
jgi:hypothetical protein